MQKGNNNMKKKKFIRILFSLIMIGTIIALSVLLGQTKNKLKVAKSEIASLSFVEGEEVVESSSEGIVTGSLKSWVFYTDDSFINAPKMGKSISLIFCELHKADLITAFSNDLFKVKYSKKEDTVRCPLFLLFTPAARINQPPQAVDFHTCGREVFF